MNITNIKKGIVVAMALTAALTAQIASAAFDTNMTFPTCSLGIYPYNPTGTKVGPLDSQWFNLFPPGDINTCNSHLNYPNQYNPQPPQINDNPLKNIDGIENISAPEARHNHIYHNASVEDNYYYKQLIDRFEITIQPDALVNTDKYNVVCYTMAQNGDEVATPGCNGNINDWGGTQISYNNSSGVITWKFATSGSGRPWIWGNNPSIGTPAGILYSSVKLISKNNPQQIWSGTTTSRILLRTQAILKANGQTSDSLQSIGACPGDGTSGSSYNYNGYWCTLPVPNHNGVLGSFSDSSTGGKTYYWYRIGSVSTVWEKPAVTTPPSATCTAINLTPNDVAAPGTTGYAARVTFDDGKSYPATVAWEQTNGSFSEATTQSHSTSAAFTNSYSTDQNAGSVTAKVTSITGANNSEACQNGMTAEKTPPPPPSATCTGITLTPNEVAAPGTTGYAASVTFDNGQSYPATVTWEQTNGSLSEATTQSHSTSAPFTNSYSTTANSGSVSAKVTSVSGAANSEVCQNGVTVTKTLSTGTCTGITLTPNVVTAPGTTGYSATVTFDNGASYPTTLQWAQTNGSFSEAAAQSHVSSSPFTNSYTTTQRAGSVTARVTDITGASNSPVCQQGVTVTEAPPPPMCQGITLTPNTVTAPGTNNYSANVTFNDGKSYMTQLAWSQTNGALSQAAVQLHQSNSAFTNTYSTTQTAGSVTAKVTNIAGAANSPACQTGITITKTPPAACQNVQLSSSAPLPLNEYQPSTFSATGTKTDGSPVTPMRWTTTAGTLTGYSTVLPEMCARSGSDLTLPSFCSILFSGAPEGTTISVSSVPPESGNICKQSTTVVKREQKPYCSYLTLSPTTLNAEEATGLNAHAVFSNGANYNTSVEWSSSNGQYSRSTSQTQNSASDFLNTFNVSDSSVQSTASVRVTAIPGGEADLGNCAAGTSVVSPPVTTPPCQNLNLSCNNGTCCVNITPSNYHGNITWNIGNRTFQTTTADKCQNIGTNSYVSAYVTNLCQARFTPPPATPPRLYKSVRVLNGSSQYRTVLTIQPVQQQKTLQYQIAFDTSNMPGVSAFISDDISNGRINAETRPTPGIGNGHVQYTAGSMRITQGGSSLPHCVAAVIDKKTKKVKVPAITDNCWNGDIGAGGVSLSKIMGPVVITYEGVINESAITADICKEGKICQEKYTNTAHVRNIMFYDSTGRTISPSTWGFPSEITSNPVLVQIFCQYILTRASGDIYLETDLNAGVDIRQCSKYTSTTGLIIMPAPPTEGNLVSTGTTTQIQSINHEICTEGQSGSIDPSLKPFYGQTVSGLSSQICEVKLQAGKAWQQSAITNDITENKTRISRWEPDYNCDEGCPHGKQVYLSELKNDPAYAQKQVYHIQNGDLVIDQPYTLADGEGAKTFIVENGNLVINNDVKYAPCNKTICNVNDIASLAFIVLNGNASISPDVAEMSGVYFVQGECAASNSSCDKGRLFSTGNANSEKQLTVYGSIYGDIQPLFENRIYSGDPSLQQSGILIRFDERVILNTPPGLRDVLSLTESQVAR
jgi:hypothetical protein